MRQIFLSYSHADKTKARRLYRDLSTAPGIKVWFDEEDLDDGMQLGPAIFKAIRESRYFIALLSKHSSSRAGYRHSELQKGLEKLAEFPDDQIYLIPARLEECEPPLEALRKLKINDLFPDWNAGVARLRKSLRISETAGSTARSGATAPPARTPEAAAHPASRKPTDYHYHLRLILLDGRTPELRDVARGLTKVQPYFYLETSNANPSRRALCTIDGTRHLDVAQLSSVFYRNIAPLRTDHVICATHRYLAFEDDGYRHWNYLGCESQVDERVAFLSTRGRADLAADAGVSFETALAYGLVTRLASYLLDIETHTIRSCPLDFTETHERIVEGLQRGRFCDDCARRLKRNPPLDEAVTAMLAFGRK